MHRIKTIQILENGEYYQKFKLIPTIHTIPNGDLLIKKGKMPRNTSKILEMSFSVNYSRKNW